MSTASTPAYPTRASLSTSGIAEVAWANLTGVPADLADGDADTQYSAGAGLVLAGAVSSLADAAVTEVKLANGSVTEPKIGSGAVTEAKLASASVNESKIVNGAVIESKIANGAVTGAKIMANAVSNSHIEDGTITGSKLASSSITADHLQASSVDAAEIAAGAVRRSELDGTEVSMHQAASGCGGGLVTTTSCRTQFCNATISGASISLSFYTCTGTCSASSAQTCLSLPHVGYLVGADAR